MLLAKDYAELTVRGQKKFGEAFFNIEPNRIFKQRNKTSYKLYEVIDIILSIKRELLNKGTLRTRTEKSFRSLSKNINKYFKDRYISEITLECIKNWINSLEVSRRTKLNNLNALREIFNFAQARNIISKNPIKDITNIDIKECLGIISYKEPDILTVEQTQLALKAAKKEVKLQLLPAITLGLFCGLRTEELKRLMWDDVNLKEGFVTIGASIAKKRRIRNVTLPLNSIDILTPFYRKGEGVSPNKYCSEFEKKIRRLKKSSGLYWGSNALRHSFGSYHYALHGDSLRTSREMGHRNGDDVLFTYYRKLVSKKQSIEYFNIK
ncbi:MAG: tyrosine-type recombinase/integrase [Coraliomargaritaceae bacterium]